MLSSSNRVIRIRRSVNVRSKESNKTKKSETRSRSKEIEESAHKAGKEKSSLKVMIGQGKRKSKPALKKTP
ncbi:MAG TPA: hypothetical protein DEA63_01570 [Firmicutes bacterium]|nr:hypothetical protein [Bacillota bacterium]